MEMLDLSPGSNLLDVACGAGRFSRLMAKSGVHATAIDQSEKFLQRARHRTNERDGKIDYLRVNASSESVLLSLGEQNFDAAVCTMALMDMASIEPLIRTLPRLLKPSGLFVFSVLHPAFNSGVARRISEKQQLGDSMSTKFGVLVNDYLHLLVYPRVGIRGQPEPRY